MVKLMMELGGIHSEKESVNFLLDKVRDPYMTFYMNHIARQTHARRATHDIVPDIHAWNFPSGRQMSNDIGIISVAEDISEMETYTACRSRYTHSNNTHLKE